MQMERHCGHGNVDCECMLAMLMLFGSEQKMYSYSKFVFVVTWSSPVEWLSSNACHLNLLHCVNSYPITQRWPNPNFYQASTLILSLMH